MRRVARTAMMAPLLVGGSIFVLTLGNSPVFAASSTGASARAASSSTAASNRPQTSSRPHKHERVQCNPGHVSEEKGQCTVTFTDPTTKKEPSAVGSTVCFSVSPSKAGSVGTGSGHCAVVGPNHKALGTFTASGGFCGKAVITAHELTKGDAPHHTTVTIVCDSKTATTTAAIIPAGSPLPPAGGWLLAAMGVAAALVTAYAVRTRNWFAPRRLAAAQSA